MRIGYDVSQTGRLKAGCGYFAHSLIERLAAIDDRNEYILYPAVGDVFWDPDGARSTFRSNRPNIRRLRAPRTFAESQAFWRAPGADFEELLERPDVFHANNFYCPRGLRRARLIYTLHDLSFMSHPEWTTEANRMGCFQGVFRASLCADLVMAVSESSRRHFLEVFPYYPAERIVVVYLASRFSGATPVRQPGSLDMLRPGGFWLSVATLEPRKNHERLLRAYARLKQQFPHAYPLVLCGGKGWMVDQFERRLADLGLSRDVIVTGYVDDTALQWLYENCFAFVYPSLFEGFGLPVLEAMSLGAPVIASRTTSIPEIVGSAGVLVDPLDEGAIAAAMQQLLTGERNRERLRAAARQEAARFSWDASARRVLDLYAQVVNGAQYVPDVRDAAFSAEA